METKSGFRKENPYDFRPGVAKRISGRSYRPRILNTFGLAYDSEQIVW
jgi:hypothetical protein